MHDPSNPDLSQLRANLVAALATFSASVALAIAALDSRIAAPEDPDTDPCPELNQARSDAMALLAAIIAAMQAVPCNVI